MTIVVIVLGAIMASFAVLGYLHGTRSAVLTLLSVLGGLAVIALGGGRIITLINAVWRVIAAGGLQTLSSGGDLNQLRVKMNAVPPLIPSNAVGAALLLLLTIIILFAVLLGRYRRFRRPPSGMGLILGLVSGYLVGAYLLDQLLPLLVTILPLPFGLGAQILEGRPAPAGAQVGDVGAQLLAAITSASQASLNAAAMILVVSIILIALLANAGSRRGTRGGGGNGGRRAAGMD